MGKAAARLGDTANTCNDPSEMPVGKVVTVGSPTVLIDKMPAAKMNDKIIGVDTHIIMIPTPGGPVPTPLPHPFNGMINLNCSTSVFIQGQPAATVDSQATNTPPHIPQGGPFQVPPTNMAKIIMGSTSVFIGSGSAGGGGGSGSGGDSGSGSSAEAEVEEGHELNVQFTDKGGNPVVGGGYRVTNPDGDVSEGPLVGAVQRSGVPDGDHEVNVTAITDAKWSKDSAAVGDTVKLTVNTAGIDDGQTVMFRIMIRDANFADRQLEEIESQISGDKAEVDWEFSLGENFTPSQRERARRRYSYPSFYFVAEVGGLTQRSGILTYRDWIELRIKDDEGNPLMYKKYKLFLSNGEVRTGFLDASGYAKIENIPPGPVRVVIDPRVSS